MGWLGGWTGMRRDVGKEIFLHTPAPGPYPVGNGFTGAAWGC